MRELAGAPEWRPAEVEEDPAITDLDRAVDVLVEMKNVSEAAVGLAYSALLFNDQGLAAEVMQLEDRLDEMREQLELWVLRARRGDGRPVAAAGPAAPRYRVGGDRRRGAATRVARRGGRGDAPRPRGRARRDRRRRACSTRSRRAARSTARSSPARRSATTPASICSRSGAAGATSTGRAAASRSQAGDEVLATGPWEGRADARRAVRLPARRRRRHRRGRARRPAHRLTSAGGEPRQRRTTIAAAPTSDGADDAELRCGRAGAAWSIASRGEPARDQSADVAADRDAGEEEPETEVEQRGTGPSPCPRTALPGAASARASPRRRRRTRRPTRRRCTRAGRGAARPRRHRARRRRRSA